jgi:hypothetical protein
MQNHLMPHVSLVYKYVETLDLQSIWQGFSKE